MLAITILKRRFDDKNVKRRNCNKIKKLGREINYTVCGCKAEVAKILLISGARALANTICSAAKRKNAL